jgi:hypothetical protein
MPSLGRTDSQGEVKTVDKGSKDASRTLEVIASSHETLINLARTLRSHGEVIDATEAIELRNFQSGPTVEEYVDAELRNGFGICWWLEVNWNENQWVIESRVTVTKLKVDEGSSDLMIFPERRAETLDEFLRCLQEATNELIQSLDLIDLAGMRLKL